MHVDVVVEVATTAVAAAAYFASDAYVVLLRSIKFRELIYSQPFSFNSRPSSNLIFTPFLPKLISLHLLKNLIVAPFHIFRDFDQTTILQVRSYLFTFPFIHALI